MAGVERQRQPSLLAKHRALLLNALRCTLKNPARSAMVILCLTALLAPFVTGIAISEGTKSQHKSALAQGGDVYVTRDHYGSNAPIELDMIEPIRGIPGVIDVIPRVIGRTYAEGKFLAVLGIAQEHYPSSIHLMQGRRPQARNEVLLSKNASAYAALEVGSRFHVIRRPDPEFRVVGIFDSSFNPWNATLLLMDFRDAAALFGLSGLATDLMVKTRPGYQGIVDVLVRLSEEEAQKGMPPLRVQTRELIDRYSQRGFNIKAGVYTGFYCLVFGLAIPCIGVISGFGLSERRREIGIMKALGWQTQEVLESVALENLLLSLASVPFVVLAAAAWIHVFNGAWISKFFIASVGVMISFPVPSKMFPIPVFLGTLLVVILTMVGSIYSTWRAAVVPPSEAMRA